MDFLRASDADNSFGHDEDGDAGEWAIETPSFGNDERRVQVAAYRHWAARLNGRFCPAPSDLDRHQLEGPRSVLIEMVEERPVLRFAGTALLDSSGAGAPPLFRDLPEGSFLALLVAHYRQVLVSREPVAFMGEHVMPSGQASLYRGVLLPLSSDGRTIDYILGTINWRELADRDLTARIVLEVDRSVARMLKQTMLFPGRGGEGLHEMERIQPELPLRA